MLFFFFFQRGASCPLRPTSLVQAGTCINMEVVGGGSKPTGALAPRDAIALVILSTTPGVVDSQAISQLERFRHRSHFSECVFHFLAIALGCLFILFDLWSL